MKKSNRTKQFENKIKKAITEIKTSLDKNPLTIGFAKYNKDNAFVSSGCALLNFGAVINQGSATRPQYVWNSTVSLSPKLIHSVIEYIRNKARKEVATPTNTSGIKQAALVLTNFTDQQLWDELKSRQYSIQNNQLCKISYLQ